MNAQVKIAGQGSELLGLGSILIGSLPAALMTDAANRRRCYTDGKAANSARKEDV